MKRLILIRHGQAENNLHDLYGGWSEVKLTELGIKQAHTVANRLSEELKKSYTLYSSDLQRAKQTAEIISNKLNLSVIYSKELREHNPGIVSGMSHEEAKQHQLEITEPYIDCVTFPGAETWREFYNRVTGYMGELDDKEDQVIIVSHGGTIHNIIRWWLGTPVADLFKYSFTVANTSISVLETSRHGQRIIQRLNDTTHYIKIGLLNPIES